MAIPLNAFTTVIEMLLRHNLKKATKFVSDKLTVKATSQRKPDGREASRVIIITFGRPNYAERKYIKILKRAGEPFPVKRVQMKPFPKKAR